VPLVAILVYVLDAQHSTQTSGSSIFGLGLAACAAALLAGALLGFLFGLPRTLEPRTRSPNARLTTSTSLDQIADWLTKMLVGIGLVELGKIAHGVSSLGQALAPGLGNGPGAKSLAVALLLYSAADGFLLGYLWTRIDLSDPLRIAADNLERVVQEVAEEIREQATPPAPPPT
jgi:hypothetical protein